MTSATTEPASTHRRRLTQNEQWLPTCQAPRHRLQADPSPVEQCLATLDTIPRQPAAASAKSPVTSPVGGITCKRCPSGLHWLTSGITGDLADANAARPV